jgi:hypothetical protein
MVIEIKSSRRPKHTKGCSAKEEEEEEEEEKPLNKRRNI